MSAPFPIAPGSGQISSFHRGGAVPHSLYPIGYSADLLVSARGTQLLTRAFQPCAPKSPGEPGAGPSAMPSALLPHRWGNPGDMPLTFLTFNINPEGVAAVLPGAPANSQ
jgi:hypothetical protein